MTLIRHWYSPSPEEVGQSLNEFIHRIGAPTRITLKGRDTSRARALVTLLHGNEPSGVKAIFHLLRERFQPAVDLHCYIIAVEAALLTPLFSHRMVPGKRDYNRCFKPPFDADHQGRVCRHLLEEIQALAPEAVVDMHNTSGEGPSFAVSRMYDKKHDRIVSLFTNRLIITDLRLGAIMETSTAELPVVTVECGGAYEETSDRIAYEGLRRFFGQDDIFAETEQDWGLEILSNPVRVELLPDAELEYGEEPRTRADLTLKVDIEHHNFAVVPRDTCLGWVSARGSQVIKALDPLLQDHFDTFYYVREGKLYTRASQKMFMITSNAEIAKGDCLWYAVKA